MVNSRDRQKVILLVEDELFVRELYQRVLTQSGYRVITAIDGIEALDKAMQQPDLILLDIMLPKLNGIEVLKKLKSDPNTKSIPIVLLTNLGQESVIVDAFQSGAQGYFMKMRLTPYQIIDKVERFIKDPDLKMDLNSLQLD